MPVRLDQLHRETRQQVLAALEEQGQLVLDNVSDGPITRFGHTLRSAAAVVGYSALAVGLLFLAFAQPSAAEGYAELLAKVGAYVARQSWAIVRENAVSLSGNVVIVIIFALGVFQAAKLAVSVIRRFWPVLLAVAGVAVALAILRLEGAQ